MRGLDNQDVFDSDFNARLESAKVTSGTANCLGTALYLVGKISSDGYLRTPDAYDRVAVLPKLDEPIVGCLVVFV